MAVVNNVVVTGYGLACALGASAGDACAAAHAGLSRASGLKVEVFDEDALEEVPLVGHSLPILTDGFGFLGRLYQMSKAALNDLLSNQTVKFTNKTALCLLLNDDFFGKAQFQRELDQLEDPEEIAEEQQEYNEKLAKYRQSVRGDLISRLVDELGFPIGAEHQFVLFGSPAQFSRVISEAVALLQKGQYDHIIIGSADSLVSAEALETLMSIGVLKTPDNPVGFMPGEAAGFITLSRADCLAGSKPIASVKAISSIERDVPLWSDTPATGKAMSDAFASLAIDASSHLPCCCVALNGMEYRALDFGTALTRLGSKGLPREFNLKMPVESFGEVGVAAGPVFACYAMHGMSRNPAKNNDFVGGAIVSLYAEDGERSAFMLGFA